MNFKHDQYINLRQKLYMTVKRTPAGIELYEERDPEPMPNLMSREHSSPFKRRAERPQEVFNQSITDIPSSFSTLPAVWIFRPYSSSEPQGTATEHSIDLHTDSWQTQIVTIREWPCSPRRGPSQRAPAGQQPDQNGPCNANHMNTLGTNRTSSVTPAIFKSDQKCRRTYFSRDKEERNSADL